MHFSRLNLTSCIFGAMFLGACTLDDLIGDPNHGTSGMTLDEKVVLGLKTALKVGIDSSAHVASQLNGYLTHKVIKILLPAEADSALKAAEKLAAMVTPFASGLQGMQGIVDLTLGLDKSSFTNNLTASNSLLKDITGLKGIGDSVVLYMNRAAEYAAPRSAPIFKDAIFSMSIADGLTLLNSRDSSAATGYLNGKTFNPLILAYSPLVDSTLTLVPLTKYWADFRILYNSCLTRYNSMLAFQAAWNGNVVVSSVTALQVTALKPISYKPIETASLGAWTTDRALTGLFYLVGEEEKDIRRDPFGYVKALSKDLADILGEVFGEIMKMQK
jgi:hypothetical protein